MVLADGSFVTASETENSDLLWALRGGGGNFGVVTSFLFRIHPVSMVYGGPIAFDLADAPTVMKWFREFQPSAPDEFCIFLGLQAVPPVDPFPEGALVEEDVRARRGSQRPARRRARRPSTQSAPPLPKPIIDWAQPMPYTAIQSLFDPLLPKGLQWYWKGDFVKELPDAAIDAHVAHAAKPPSASPRCTSIRSTARSIEKKQDATAWGYRDAAWSLVIFGVDPDPANAPALKQWAQDYWTAVHPFNLAGAYAELHDGRRGRCAGQGRIRRQLRTPCER